MCDGYAVLIDLGQPGSAAAVTSVTASSASSAPALAAARFERGASGKKSKSAALPADGTKFVFSPDVPKWVTVDAEFRDHDGKFWPSFLYGKPVEGSGRLENGRLQAAFTVACTSVVQPKGNQSRRLLGELLQGERPVQVKLTIESLDPMQTAELAGIDEKGRSQTRTVEFYPGHGILQIGDATVHVSPRVTFGFGKTRGVYRGAAKVDPAIDVLYLNAFMTLKPADLGLKSPDAADPIDVRIGMSGVAPPPPIGK